MGTVFAILGRVVAGAALGFLCCSLVWFPFWYAVAWISNGQPPGLSNIPAGMFLTDPTWVLIIFSIPILGGLHGLIRGADRRVPISHIGWESLKGCFAAFGVFGQGAEIGCALLGLLLLLPAIVGAALGAWVCHITGVKDTASGVMPGFVASAILGLFGMNLLVLRLSAASQEADLGKVSIPGRSAAEPLYGLNSQEKKSP